MSKHEKTAKKSVPKPKAKIDFKQKAKTAVTSVVDKIKDRLPKPVPHEVMNEVNEAANNMKASRMTIEDRLASLKEYDPQLHEDIQRFYREAFETRSMMRTYYDKYNIAKNSIVVEARYNDALKNPGDQDILEVIDSVISRRSTDTSLKDLGIDPKYFDMQMQRDPDHLFVYVFDRLRSVSTEAEGRQKDAQAPSKNDMKEYEKEWQNQKEEFRNRFAVDFQAVRELGSWERSPEVRRLLSDEDDMEVQLNASDEDIAAHKSAMHLAFVILRGAVKPWHEVRTKINEIKQEQANEAEDLAMLISAKKAVEDEKRQVDSALDVAKSQLDIAQKSVLSSVRLYESNVKAAEIAAARASQKIDDEEAGNPPASDSGDNPPGEGEGGDRPDEQGDDDDKPAQKPVNTAEAAAEGALKATMERTGYMWVEILRLYVRKAKNANGSHNCIRQDGKLGGAISDKRYVELTQGRG